MKMPSLCLIYFLGLIAISVLFAFAAYLQINEGLRPCPLCIMQRGAFILLSLVFLVGAFVPLKKIRHTVIGIGAFLCAGIGAALAARQVWIQHFPTNADCGASLEYMLQAFPFNQVLQKVLKGSAECAERSWEFLHLSLAEWSLLCFSAFLIITLWQIKRAMALKRPEK
jgi:protein dithiol:quinone oxidoreductase